MNIIEIREVLRAPIGAKIGDRQVTREWKTDAWEERKIYEQALMAVLQDPKVNQDEKEWADVDLEIIRNPLQAVLCSWDGVKTEGDKKCGPPFHCCLLLRPRTVWEALP